MKDPPQHKESFAISLEKLQQLCDPFVDAVWWETEDPLTREEVALAIDEKWDDPEHAYSFEWATGGWTRKQHIARVASFVEHGWSKPLSLDMGAPDWVVMDGNHRLAAAIYLKKKTVMASISGDEALIEELFGISHGE